MKPLFEVGEQVILRSKYFPQYDGEYMVFEVIKPFQSVRCRLTNQLIHFEEDGVGYILNEPHVDHDDDDGNEVLWCQSSLRKKHKPSELSFNEMMNTFKITEKM